MMRKATCLVGAVLLVTGAVQVQRGEVWINADSIRMRVGDDGRQNTGLTIKLPSGAGYPNDFIAFRDEDHVQTAGVQHDNTVGFLMKSAAGTGLHITGLASTGAEGLAIGGTGAVADTSKSTTAIAPVFIGANLSNGEGARSTVGVDGNLVVIYEFGQARFVFDREGDLHLDSTNNPGSWDDYEDTALVRDLRAAVRGRTISPAARAILDVTDVATFNDEDGSIFINIKAWTYLLADTILQQDAEIALLRSDVAGLRAQVEALMER